jgi:hypothetical protein
MDYNKIKEGSRKLLTKFLSLSYMEKEEMIKPTIVTFDFDGIQLSIPEKLLPIFPSNYTYKTFPDNFCGAGDGIGEKLVPDYIFGPTRFLKFIGLNVSIKLSPACWIHDKDWIVAEPTWEAFGETNDRFHKNLEAIIEAKCKYEWLKARALYRPVTYRNAVSIAGKSVFWSLKSAQGFHLPKNAYCHVDIQGKNLMKQKMKAGDL